MRTTTHPAAHAGVAQQHRARSRQGSISLATGLVVAAPLMLRSHSRRTYPARPSKLDKASYALIALPLALRAALHLIGKHASPAPADVLPDWANGKPFPIVTIEQSSISQPLVVLTDNGPAVAIPLIRLARVSHDPSATAALEVAYDRAVAAYFGSDPKVIVPSLIVAAASELALRTVIYGDRRTVSKRRVAAFLLADAARSAVQQTARSRWIASRLP